ncbi:uroporphyrinogen-III synthase-like [Diadema antillarum]|uniref:uroporphyrinogen-III synthase-like n=1 Tax=Diadema antillarum TaxID=105358 RepID=UPI003A85ECF5
MASPTPTASRRAWLSVPIVRLYLLALLCSEATWNRELKEKWRQLPAFSVGTSTGSRVRSLGLEPVGEDSGNAENLVKIIISAVKPGSKPLLYPCGTMRRETIPKTLEKEGIDFTADVVYQTIANTGLADQLMRYIKEKGAPDCIVFFSPSGVQYSKEVLEIHKDELSNTKFLAIGSTTQIAMEEKGYLVAGVADKPNPQALLQAIQQCLQEGRDQ